jgi:hypothetical protein
MKVKNPEQYNARGQSSSSRSSKKRKKSTTHRRLRLTMASPVRQARREGKITYSQSQGTVIPNPAIDPARRVNFLEWFTSILPKGEDEQPMGLFARMKRSVIEATQLGIDEEEGVHYNPETRRHEYEDQQEDQR